jgi:hypothetical protein
VIAAAAVDVLVGVTPMMTSMGTLLVAANISRRLHGRDSRRADRTVMKS